MYKTKAKKKTNQKPNLFKSRLEWILFLTQQRYQAKKYVILLPSASPLKVHCFSEKWLYKTEVPVLKAAAQLLGLAGRCPTVFRPTEHTQASNNIWDWSTANAAQPTEQGNQVNKSL